MSPGDMTPSSGGPTGNVPDELASEEIRALTLSGTKLVLLRGFAVKVLLFVGGLVLARMLGPADFGLVAMGLTVMAFASLLADGGLAAGLIRRAEPPTRVELESLVGWQLVLTTGLAMAGLGVAGRLGGDALVIATMVCGLPFTALQVSGAITLERSLRFGPRVVVELVEAVVWVAAALALVAAGLGVWGMAVATVLRPAAGAVAMTVVSPVGWVTPRPSWGPVRRLIGFGLRFQAVGAVNLLRDQGLNLLVLALGGLTAVGLWSLAFRIMQLPFLVLDALWRVSYPATARFLTTGLDVLPVVRTALASVTIGNAVVLVALGSASQAVVPVLFGAAWDAATPVLLPSCLGLLLAGPVSVTAAGLLYARGATRLILLTSLVHTVVWLVVTAALWASLGVGAVGYGWLAAGLVDCALLGRGLRRQAGGSVMMVMVRPTMAAVLASALGMAVTAALPLGLGAVTCGALAGVVAFAALLTVIDRPALAVFVRLVREALGAGVTSASMR